jgi:alkane 1-monooxygenase
MRNSPWQALPYLAGFLLPPHVARCISEGGWWTFLPVATVFVAVPIVDALGGMSDEARPSPDVDANFWFRVVTWAWVPMQLGLLAWVLTMATSGRLSALEIAGATVSMGVTSGALGITFAHELVHRRGRFERALGEILLASVSYTHFAIEHVHGHHRHVGTPADPATARFGESFYRFLPRTLAGSLASAWQLEVERLARRGRMAWSPANRMLRYGLTQVLLWAALVMICGPTGVVVFAGQAAIAFSLLEVINYIEHYGLMRREIAPGEYERIAPQHSWDSSYRVSNWMLINLARHSDHHCVASRRYQSLELPAPAPQLPAGYGAMFLLALIPPLWFRVMDPRVTATRQVNTVR